MSIFKKVIQIAIVILFLFLINFKLSYAQKTAINSNVEFYGASWISAENEKILTDSLRYGDHPAPLFRKEFSVYGKLRNATLTITAAGYYLASFNGKSIENNLLDPAWTNFSKRIYASTFDVTSLIKSGKNSICVQLGNGFYNLLPLRMWGSRNLRLFLPCGEPEFIACLQLTYSDGKNEMVVTDSDWKTAEGPIVRNSIYLGEFFDARKEITGWNLPGFDDQQWKKTVKTNGPGGIIQPSFFPVVKMAGTIKAATIRQSGETILVDMGVNLTGTYKIRLKGETGDTILFKFGERLYENGALNPMTTVAGQIKRKGRGGPGSPDIAWQTDGYIFGKEKEISYQPYFTFHTFRYIEISGLKYVLPKEDVVALPFHTNVENQNYFTCSSALLNNIQKACRQTFLNNLISVQSDCPARERFGYGGDLNATSEAYIANFDMQSFYRKTIYDWTDAMQDSIFIDTAPFVGIKYCGISWESAFLTTQYKLYQYYNDTAIVSELYQKDLEWMDKVHKLHPDGLIDKGLSDHEALGKVPVQLIGTTHYLDCTRIMKRFAAISHDADNINKFSELEQSLTRKLLDLYWRKPVPDPINRQTLFATLIYYQLIPQKDLAAATDSLLKAVRNEPSGHFITGIFGTKYILEALSMTGHAAEVFKIVNSRAYPGWGHMIDRGATTIWETWKESDNTYSNCHPMFGTVSEWYYRWLAGIRPLADYPGFKKFIVSPTLPDGLNQVNAVYHAPSGDIKVAWNKNKEGLIEVRVTIPPGTSAQFIPTWKRQKYWNVTNVNTNFIRKNVTGDRPFELQEGVYLMKEW